MNRWTSRGTKFHNSVAPPETHTSHRCTLVPLCERNSILEIRGATNPIVAKQERMFDLTCSYLNRPRSVESITSFTLLLRTRRVVIVGLASGLTW